MSYYDNLETLAEGGYGHWCMAQVLVLRLPCNDNLYRHRRAIPSEEAILVNVMHAQQGAK